MELKSFRCDLEGCGRIVDDNLAYGYEISVDEHGYRNLKFSENPEGFKNHTCSDDHLFMIFSSLVRKGVV